jgi:hypothetical protein
MIIDEGKLISLIENISCQRNGLVLIQVAGN